MGFHEEISEPVDGGGPPTQAVSGILLRPLPPPSAPMSAPRPALTSMLQLRSRCSSHDLPTCILHLFSSSSVSALYKPHSDVGSTERGSLPAVLSQSALSTCVQDWGLPIFVQSEGE